MNTIKIVALFLIGILLFAACGVTAPTNQFPTTRTIQGNVFTYQVTVSVSGIVRLFNKDNQYRVGDGRRSLRDGSPIPPNFWMANIDPLTDIVGPLKECSDVINSQVSAIVRDALSAAERQRVGNSLLDVYLRIDPDTGLLFEVEFGFVTENPFATIPVQVFRIIEVNLKEQLRFTPTERGRKLNFISPGVRVRL